MKFWTGVTLVEEMRLVVRGGQDLERRPDPLNSGPTQLFMFAGIVLPVSQPMTTLWLHR